MVILCQKCSDVEVKRIGELCLGCEAEEKKQKGNPLTQCQRCSAPFWGNGLQNLCPVCRDKMATLGQGAPQEKIEVKPKKTLITMWCPTCQMERIGISGNKTHCGECEAELQIRQSVPDPMTYFCPTPYCAHKVEVEGMQCGDCQIEGLKKVEEPNINPPKPNHVKLVAIPNNLLTFLKMADQYTKDLACLQKNIEYNNARIVIELQKAVKEVEGAESL